jgi:uncharacterized protein (TIGR03437 family)
MKQLVLCFVLPAVAAVAQSSMTDRMQDFNFVTSQLPKSAPNFFRKLDPVQFQQAVTTFGAKMSTLTDQEFYVGLAKLVAMSGDSSTAIYLSGSAFNAQFPLQFRWLDDGCFVTAAAARFQQTLGTQLVAVGGVPIDQVVQRLGTIFAYDNNQWLHYLSALYLQNQSILQGLDIVPAAATSSMTFRTLAGNEFTLDIDTDGGTLTAAIPASAGPRPDYLQNQSSYYWYTYSADNRLLYLKYNVCEDDPNGMTVATLSSLLLNELDTNPVDTFVIDFRHNTGGNEYLLFPLGKGLLQRLPSLQANPRFRVYLAIDKGSAGSGMYTPMAFKTGFMAKTEGLHPVDTSKVMFVIGEATGGKPVGPGDVVTFTLPGSQMPGQYSIDYVDQNEGVIPEDATSFNPDIPISIRSTDFFARYDPVMGAILARSSGPPPAPSGGVTTVNAASFRIDQGLAPGSFAAAFGTFAVSPDQVLVAGVSAKILSAAASQVNFIIPTGVSPGTVSVSVRAAGQELASGQATITTAGPGLFVADGTNPYQPAAAENQDYSINSATNPAAQGSIVQIFGTGYGTLDSSGNADVQVYFADTRAEVLYSGPAPQFPGLWQVNARVPGTITGQVPVFIVAGNMASNGVTISVQ